MFILLDCCYSGTWVRFLREQGKTVLGNKYQEIAILSSVREDSSTLDDFSGGFFTISLLKIWKLEFERL